MPDNEPLDFKFDTSGFEAAMKKMANGFDSFQKSGKNIASGISKGFSNVAGKIAKIGVAIAAVKSALAQIPEVGQAFGIAKDVIIKNLLFPLRKELFPMLQKMLDWVRDNRAQFVKWGRVLANVFGSVVSLVGKLIDTGKRLIDNFMGFIGRVFGVPVQNLEKTINLLTFKLSVALNFLGSLIDAVLVGLSPVFDIIGNSLEIAIDLVINLVESLFSVTEEGNSIKTIFETVLKVVTSIANFFVKITASVIKGFLPAIKRMLDPLQKIIDSIKIIFDEIFTGEDALKEWEALFTSIGKVVGDVLVVALETVAELIVFIADNIGGLNDFFNLFNVSKQVGDFFSKKKDKDDEKKGRVKKVNDAILRPDGTIVETAPDDTLIATKTPGDLGGGGRALTLNFGDFYFTVPAGPITEDTAVNLGNNIVDVVRAQLDREFLQEGL